MNVYIPLSFLLVLLCFLYRNRQKKAERVFLFSMISLFVFAALRYDFGPDYSNYLAIYENVQGELLDSYSGAGSSLERGFLYYLLLFPYFSLFIAVNSFLWFTVYYLFIKKYTDAKFYWIILAALCFTSSAIIGNLVAMRTALCGILLLFALFFLLNGKRLPYVVIILLASLIHTSAIVMIVFVLLNTKKRSVLFSTPFIIICGFVGLLSVIVGENIGVSSIVSFVVDNVEEMQRYENYSVGGANQSIMAFLFRMLAFVVFLYLESAAKKEQQEEYIIIYKIAIITCLLRVLLGQNIVSDRFVGLLNPVYFVALARSIKYQKPEFSWIAIGSMMGIAVYLFYVKMTKDYSVSFLQYQTIFSAQNIP